MQVLRLQWRRIASNGMPVVQVGHFERILLPVDFSSECDVAAHHAAWFAQTTGGTVHLVHVIVNPLDDLYDTHALPPLQVVDAAEAKALSLLRAVAERCLPASVTRVLHIRHGDPYEKLRAVADEIHPDLIVLSTRGRGGIAHLVIGSVAEKIVRHALCPLFVVPRPNK
ncbi:MAG: universal stress protein [Candidatus Binatia bacterium]|nr:universal stress protein [Candidatus Binatia bacterium]